jgi:biotin transport system substrate-specific component
MMASVLTQMKRVATLEVVPSVTARRVLLVALFTALTALGAHISVPLEPVPVTLQTLFVTLAGAVLGPYLGGAAMLAYIAAGVAGVPAFAMGAGFVYLLGPTGGYLLSYPLAAAVTGKLCGPRSQAGVAGYLRIAFAMAVASLLILLLGWSQLALLTGDAQRALQVGVLPFLFGDVLKIAVGAFLAQQLRPRTHGLI